MRLATLGSGLVWKIRDHTGIEENGYVLENLTNKF